MQWNALYALLLFSCTVITYAGAVALPALKRTRTKKLCLCVCIVINLAILGYFKYFEFAVHVFSKICIFLHLTHTAHSVSILLPVGISFFTLQALGYLIDVYRNTIAPEKNFFRYALFVSFFPQLVAGPIERSKNLLHQLKEPKPLRYDTVRYGLWLILYGLFLKLVISDNLSPLVDAVYKAPQDYQGAYIAIATVCFAFQIYCDFYAYSIIAKGSALLFGISLMNNFEAPYYSYSVKEFWRNWHISLSSWFKDYVYIPLGGNRKGWKHKALNLLIVFAISGLWHGAAFGFIVWGLLNGLYLVIEDRLAALQNKFPALQNGARRQLFCKKLLHTAITFFLITVSWIFFRARGVHKAAEMLQNMCGHFALPSYRTVKALLGLNRNGICMLCIALCILCTVDFLKKKGIDVAQCLCKQDFWFRYIVFAFLFFTIILFGHYGDVYDAKQFIYFQF